MTARDTTIYMDNNATTPLDPRVLEAMMPFLTDCFGNAASKTHAYGWEAEAAVDRARARIARLIMARPNEIVLTSGATESTNLALTGLADAHPAKRHVVTVATEHKATLDTTAWLEKRGLRRTVLPTSADGLLDPAALAAALTEDTLAVSVMAVNNETGVIQPLAEVGRICHERGVPFHCDAAQAFGKMRLDVGALGIDLMSVSGHKIYGPKGVGALFVRRRNAPVRLLEQMHGGGHEQGMRSGTLNVPGIVGLGAAADFAGRDMEAEATRVFALRERLRSRLETELGHVRLNGSLEHRIEGNLNVSFDFVEGESLLLAMKGIAVSSGSACNSSTVEPSYVLTAMGLGVARAMSSIRFGIGRFNTEQDVDGVADVVIDTVRRLRAMSPAWKKHEAATS